jgi:hypothetical protein
VAAAKAYTLPVAQFKQIIWKFKTA